MKRRVSELAETLLETLSVIDASDPAAEKIASIFRRRAEKGIHELRSLRPLLH